MDKTKSPNERAFVPPSVVIGYTYSKFAQDHFKKAEKVFTANSDSTGYDVYQCTTGVDEWKCSAYAPGIADGNTDAENSAAAW